MKSLAIILALALSTVIAFPKDTVKSPTPSLSVSESIDKSPAVFTFKSRVIPSLARRFKEPRASISEFGADKSSAASEVMVTPSLITIASTLSAEASLSPSNPKSPVSVVKSA